MKQMIKAEEPDSPVLLFCMRAAVTGICNCRRDLYIIEEKSDYEVREEDIELTIGRDSTGLLSDRT